MSSIRSGKVVAADYCMMIEIVLKGQYTQKMKILSFTQRQLLPNLYECVCSEDILWETEQYFIPTL